MRQCCMLDRERGVRCENRGTPEPGFKFFMCPACCDALEDLLNAIALRESALVNPAGRKN